jgi:glucose-6-phosphate 1-dehydrogenase
MGGFYVDWRRYGWQSAKISVGVTMHAEDRETYQPQNHNHIQEAPPRPPVAPPCVMVIFGASGDLTKRKLIPALFNLRRSGLLGDQFAVLGVARKAKSDEELRQQVDDYIAQCDEPEDPDCKGWLLQRVSYLQGDVGDAATYHRIKERLASIDGQFGAPGNYLYYLATAPTLFSPIVQQLGASGLIQEAEGHWRRVVIEKPFGHDLESARELNRQLSQVLREDQTYRIDHYLGKETEQNIMAFRFANGIFEPIWNRRYIDHVQITAAEEVGVEQRGGYYDESGALRDMVPNHLFQLVSLTAMEPPTSFAANSVRDEQTKVLRAMQPFTPEEVLRRTVRGQYGEGIVGKDRRPAYRAELNVPPSSNIETYVALKLYLDNWRWADIPFYLRTGKSMKRRETHISIHFRQPPLMLFRDTPVEHLQPNRLVIDIQPDEAISLSFGAKLPGPQLRLGTVDMRFAYKDYFGQRPSTGYERLLYDCMTGDATLFQRADMVEAGWTVVAPVLDVWKALPPRDFPNYPAGSWGPKEADELLARSGRAWYHTPDRKT